MDPIVSKFLGRSNRLLSAAPMLVCLLGIGGVFLAGNYRDAFSLLIDDDEAAWVGYPEEVSLRVRPLGSVEATFRKRFAFGVVPDSLEVSIDAQSEAAVSLNGEPMGSVAAPAGSKARTLIDLAPHLGPLVNELRVSVRNVNGPVALRVGWKDRAGSADVVGTGSGGWEVRREGPRDSRGDADSENEDSEADSEFDSDEADEFANTSEPGDAEWVPVHRLSDPLRAGIAEKFPQVTDAFLKVLPYLLPVFLGVFLLSLYYGSLLARFATLKLFTLTASRIRFLVCAAWGVLTINNIARLPASVGFDVAGHIEYIQRVAETGVIPFANEGWQMFQSPLYYIISAPLYKALVAWAPPESIRPVLRLIPFLCGALQVEVCYRALKLVFPGRDDLQAMGTVVGGLLPMNLYLSQTTGNEPMAGLFTGLAVVVVFSILLQSEKDSFRPFATLGLCLGLALLTKVTTILIVPPALLCLFVSAVLKRVEIGRACLQLATVVGVATLICGWYYYRNWMVLGKPFVGGWDPSRSIVWWQDPGYRTLGDLTSFGQSLVNPVYSCFSGFWDGLYSTMWTDGYLSSIVDYKWRPPWNYSCAFAIVWLSLLPCAAIVIGGVVAVLTIGKPASKALTFATLCVVVYIAALMFLYLQLPAYSTTKASYTAGLTPCYAVLAASGLGLLTKVPLVRPLVHALLTCWALTAFLAFFVW